MQVKCLHSYFRVKRMIHTLCSFNNKKDTERKEAVHPWDAVESSISAYRGEAALWQSQKERSLWHLTNLWGSSQPRWREEMQEGLLQGDSQADGVPAPLIMLSKKGLGWRATVKTVSKDTRNKSRQGQVFLFLKYLTIPSAKQPAPKPILLLMQIKQSCDRDDIGEYLLQRSAEQMNRPIHKRTGRRSTALSLPAPADSLYSQYKLTFGMES